MCVCVYGEVDTWGPRREGGWCWRSRALASQCTTPLHKEDQLSVSGFWRGFPIYLKLLLENKNLPSFHGQRKHHSFGVPSIVDHGPRYILHSSLSILLPLPTPPSLSALSLGKQGSCQGLGRAREGCQALFGLVGQQVFPGEGIGGLGEGEGVERPPSFSPDRGEEMQVH